MNKQLEFLYGVIPYELLPGIYEDPTGAENMVYRHFLKETYHAIVDKGCPAVLAAIKFWLTLDDFYFRAVSARIMPQPLTLEEFAEKWNNEDVNTLLSTKKYNRIFYAKLFRNEK